MVVSVQFQARTEFTKLYAIEESSRMRHIYDYRDKLYKNREGIILNSIVADKLGVGKGDTVELKVIGFSKREVRVPVDEVITESFGGASYMDIAALVNYFPMDKPVNTILMRVNKGEEESVKSTLHTASRLSAMVDSRAVLDAYKDLLQKMTFMIDIFIVLSIITAIVLIYNISLISISERNTEFATLIIMGVSDKEIKQMIHFEQIIYLTLGFIMGLPLSRLIKIILEVLILSDDYRIELDMSLMSYTKSMLMCVSIIIISGLAVIRAVRQIDPADSLKDRN